MYCPAAGFVICYRVINAYVLEKTDLSSTDMMDYTTHCSICQYYFLSVYYLYFITPSRPGVITYFINCLRLCFTR